MHMYKYILLIIFFPLGRMADPVPLLLQKALLSRLNTDFGWGCGDCMYCTVHIFPGKHNLGVTLANHEREGGRLAETPLCGGCQGRNWPAMDWMEIFLVLLLNPSLYAQITGQLWHICGLQHLLLLLFFSLDVKLCEEFRHGYLPAYCLSYGGNYEMGSSFLFSFQPWQFLSACFHRPTG